LDVTAVKALHTQVLAHCDDDLVLDLAKVTQMGALCLQVCIAAARHASGAGHAFQIVNASDAVLSQFHSMGFTPESLAEGAL
jgi:anti-anti-sigma regulatory factor